MLEALEDAVEELEIDLDGDCLVGAFELLSRLSAKVCAAVGEFDAAGLWSFDAATSMTAWLKGAARMTGKDAARFVRSAHLLASLPVTSAAWADGTLSQGQVTVILVNLKRKTVGLFAEHEAELIPTFAPMSVAQVTRAMQHWARLADDGDDPAEPERWLMLCDTLDGRYEGKMSLDAATGSTIAAALALAETKDCEGEPKRSAATRRADALADIARYFLDHHGSTSSSRRNRPHLDVIVDVGEDGLTGEVLGGPPLDPATISALLCDSTLNRVLSVGRSRILDYGTATRTATDVQFRALVARDRGCRLFADCDRGPEFCEVHHIIPVEEGGATDMVNMALGCSRHHHVVHQRGWSVKRLPNGEVHVTDPNGRVWINAPPP